MKSRHKSGGGGGGGGRRMMLITIGGGRFPAWEEETRPRSVTDGRVGWGGGGIYSSHVRLEAILLHTSVRDIKNRNYSGTK